MLHKKIKDDLKIVHKPPLYDSLDEEEIQGDDDLDNIFINPEGINGTGKKEYLMIIMK